jgi:thiamine-monophosphate kinase
LLADLSHILDCSGTGADLEIARIPLSLAGRGLPDALSSALAGGDDYELLFTAPPTRADAVSEASSASGVPVTRIGTITAEKGLRLLDTQGHRVDAERLGWRHF